MKSFISVTELDEIRSCDGYDQLLERLQNVFDENIGRGDKPLFTTNAGDLFSIFLSNLPEDARQYYNCRECMNFINKYGQLVLIKESIGTTVPAIWPVNVPPFFSHAIQEVRAKVKAAQVTGVFVPDSTELGKHRTGKWTHMAINIPKRMVTKDALHNSYQIQSVKTENFSLLHKAVRTYDLETVEIAVNMLKSETLYRGNEILGMALWFRDVLKSIESKKRRINILWFYSAVAPEGYCHIANTMLGTLLDDIKSGNRSFAEIKSSFDKKMSPDIYKRPQALPTRGNVNQAELVIGKLGLEPSLRRRYARLDEVETIWRPASVERRTGVFASVETKDEMRSQERHNTLERDMPAVTMTWEKFRRKVLPDARKIEFYVDDSKSGYAAILTASDITAPPIIAWDSLNERCPFSWYVYGSGSRASQWSLSRGYVKVTGITLQPNMWTSLNKYSSEAVFLLLEGCKDQRHDSVGLGLFPEVVKPELRGVRATIEAFSRNGKLEGYEDASACGIRLQAGSAWWNAKLRVTTDNGVTIYNLDRWD